MNPAQFNKSQLANLLTIEDPRRETIFGVIGRMKVLLEFFKHDKKYHSLIPFLITYYYVTKASANKYITKQHYFLNLKDHELLDVYFASLYFNPLLVYLTEGKYVRPWQQYFTYSELRSGTPFLQMLLGINAHINGDLYTALLDLEYKNQHDFFLVNDVLQEVTPKVMHFLAFKMHDVVGIAGSLFKDLTQAEFHYVIERWRSEAWVNALLTTPQNREQKENKILHETENVGAALIRDFSEINHVGSIVQTLSSVNSHSVQVAN